MKNQAIRSLLGIGFMFALSHALVSPLSAHCDTMSGPVVQAAQKALETGNVDPALIWVQAKDEDQIKKAFDQARTVRSLSPEAREMADMYFFETLVRIHRAGEGEPYTGILPAGSQVDPSLEMADRAVETGSAKEVITKIPANVSRGIQEKFNAVKEAKKHMHESVEAGRKYVEAYVAFIHYVEGIHNAAMSRSTRHEEPGREK